MSLCQRGGNSNNLIDMVGTGSYHGFWLYTSSGCVSLCSSYEEGKGAFKESKYNKYSPGTRSKEIVSTNNSGFLFHHLKVTLIYKLLEN